MQCRAVNDTYIIKLERGEKVLETLTAFCADEQITFATLSAIGAVENVKCGYYDLPTKTYHFTDYPNLVEVVSMTGNVSLKDDKPFLHVHAVFTDQENQAFGGHVVEMVVGVTLEVVLKKIDIRIERQFDEDIGLHLLNCCQ